MFPTLPDIDINSIDPANPWEKDQLDRQTQIAPLERLLLSVTDRPMTLALDSGWGTGKSSLLAMWSAALRQQGRPCVLFNAWNTDYAVDPLVAFVEELTTQLDQQRVFQEYATEIKALTNKLRARPLDLIATLAKILAKCVGTDVDGLIEACRLDKEMDFVTAHHEQKEYMEDFRKQLGELVEKISKSEEHQLPMVIFVDELDRCRPDYAVKLLERIKHLFNVKGIIFVLAVDRNHLVQSVNQLYGLGESGSDAYLRRFIDLDYRLPDPSWERFVPYAIREMGITPSGWPPEMRGFITNHRDRQRDLFQFDKLLLELCRIYSPSLRDAYQIFSMLAVIIKSYNPKSFSLSICCALLFIRKKDLYFYENYKYNFSNFYKIDDSEQITTMTRTHGLQCSESPFKCLYATCNKLFSSNTENAQQSLKQLLNDIDKKDPSSPTEPEAANMEYSCIVGLLNELPEYESILAQVAFAAAFSVDPAPLNQTLIKTP